jgi:hypothetical protein
MFWTKMSDLGSMTEAQLTQWHADGVGGFVGGTYWLWGMGGSNEMSGNPSAVSGSNYSLEEAIESSNIVTRVHALGMKLYLGFNLVNYFNTQTPLAEWFDDSAWDNTVIPAVQAAAAAAHMLGFDGIAMDQELYPQKGGAKTATWVWDYPGNTHTEAQVRGEAVLRGQQVMAAIVSVFPGVEIADYDASFPESWDADVRQQVKGDSSAFSKNLDVNFWDGMTSVDGYSGIWFYDEYFYKTYAPASSWAQALSYEENSVYAYLSRNFSNWSYASSRVFATPSAWIDGDVANEGTYSAPRPPDYVAQQLQAFRDWGTGGAFAVFCYASLGQFDYSPYVPGIQAAATPGIVDTDPPTISVTGQNSNSGSLTLSGTAKDDDAIQYVSWSSSTGSAGTAQDTWQITSGSVSGGYRWQTVWTIPSIPIAPGPNVITITAVDTHGLTATATIDR